MSNWESIKLIDLCNVEYGTRVVRKRDGGTIFPVYGGGGATFSMDVYNRENIFYFNRVKYERVNQLPLMPSLGLSLTF